HHYIDFRDAEGKVFADQMALLDKRVNVHLHMVRDEYEGQISRESVIARDADILECLVQAKEYVDNGYPVAKTFFKRAPLYLKTACAKKLWNKILSWDSHVWWQHIVKFER
ncbi:MAG: HAD family hydrolase, partial [Candidatus Omnitrophica bacterium]|nr:HAD family hydrolase [Candidatus Omnitrophota bacterium]